VRDISKKRRRGKPCSRNRGCDQNFRGSWQARTAPGTEERLLSLRRGKRFHVRSSTRSVIPRRKLREKPQKVISFRGSTKVTSQGGTYFFEGGARALHDRVTPGTTGKK